MSNKVTEATEKNLSELTEMLMQDFKALEKGGATDVEIRRTAGRLAIAKVIVSSESQRLRCVAMDNNLNGR